MTMASLHRFMLLIVAIAMLAVPAVRADGERAPDGLTASDWSSIRAAYEAERHAALPVHDGYLAHNPGQAWRTHFDGRGILTTPDGGGWSWGLELVSYGRRGAERAFSSAAAGLHHHDQRIEYAWDATLTEWYINDQRGLEHGYIVHHCPGGGAGPLHVTVNVRGGLVPRINATPRDAAFFNADGAAVVNYSNLTVFDAAGAIVPAWFEVDQDNPRSLRIVVDDSNAVYPLTIDPLAQQAYLKASNTSANDYFGYSVAVCGDTVVVGAYQEDSNATGVNGNQADNSASNSGAAYIFVRSGNVWSQQAYLKASNTEAGDQFGYSVAVSGDTVVVGAYGEDSSATGVNGNQASNSADASGAVYIFVRSGSDWSQQAYLKASNTGTSDLFGYSLAISGDTVVVGALFEDSNATGVNGNQANNSVDGSGAAYIFARSGNAWSQQAYLKASNTGAIDQFGYAVAISGDTVVVAAPFEDSNAVGVNGNGANNSSGESGAAYIFVRDGAVWSQQAYLKASNTDLGDQFGWSVAVSGDTVVVGAPSEDSNGTGVNGVQNNNNSLLSGAAYIFIRFGAAWGQQAYLKPGFTQASANFGFSVAVSGDSVVVGAPRESGSATGVNGNPIIGGNSIEESGAAYMFTRVGTAWSQLAYLKASNTGAGDFFGHSVAVCGGSVVVGAFEESSNATGVNGNQADNSANSSGAAYIFALPPSAGACCINGIAIQTVPADCSAAGGVFFGEGVPSDQAMCDPACPQDINGDGVVNGADLSVLLSNFGQSCL